MPITTKSSDSPAERYYTDAPRDYDWGWTRTVIGNFGVSEKNREVRLVEISDGYHADYQTGRYSSGMHFALTEEQAKDWISRGWIKVNPPEQQVYQFSQDFDVQKVMEDEEKCGPLRDFYLGHRGEHEDYKLEPLNGGYGIRLTVVGPKDKSEQRFKEIAAKIEGFLV